MPGDVQRRRVAYEDGLSRDCVGRGRGLVRHRDGERLLGGPPAGVGSRHGHRGLPLRRRHYRHHATGHGDRGCGSIRNHGRVRQRVAVGIDEVGGHVHVCGLPYCYNHSRDRAVRQRRSVRRGRWFGRRVPACHSQQDGRNRSRRRDDEGSPGSRLHHRFTPSHSYI